MREPGASTMKFLDGSCAAWCYTEMYFLLFVLEVVMWKS